jgi:2Fe-2S ferredoxin
MEPRKRVFIQANGRVDAAQIDSGMSLMEAAVRHNVPGIIAECGGTCACGTCHVIVDDVWRERLADPGFDEADLLEFLDNSQEGSRLGCQIVMTDQLDGIVVRVPPRSH